MSGDNTAVVLPSSEIQKSEVNSSASPDLFTTEIIQGVFASESDRDTFMQAVSVHGVTFLRCAESPLSKPTIDQLSAIEKLARTVSLLWSRSSVDGGRS